MLNFFINQSATRGNLSQILIKIPGVGKKKIRFICKQAGLLENCAWVKVTDGQITWLASWIEENFIGKHAINLDFRKAQKERILFLKTVRHFKGIRLLKGLPARGQRTRSNAKTVRKIKY